MAPSARADNAFTDILTDIQTSISVGEQDLTDGAGYFSADNVPEGLAYDLGGVDSLLFGPGYDIFDDGTDALTGSGSVTDPFYDPPVTAPTDLADATTLAQSYMDAGDAYFTTAGTDFAANDFSDWALNTVLGTEDFVSASDEAIIGLFAF